MRRIPGCLRRLVLPLRRSTQFRTHAAVGCALTLAIAALRSPASPSDEAASSRVGAARLVSARPPRAPSDAARTLDATLTALERRLSALDRPDGTVTERRHALRDARREYKRIEGLLEYYAPELSHTLNGASEDERADEAVTGKTPLRGLQYLEEALYSADAPRRPDAARRIGEMRVAIARFRTVIPAVAPTAAELLEIGRLELGRVSTLGIAGFDAPLSGMAVTESADALYGVRSIVGPLDRAVDSTLARAAAYLGANPDFERFDRFRFVTDYANPAFGALDAARRRLHQAERPVRRTWPATVPSVYDARRFDAWAYSPPAARSSRALADVGRTLFFDPALSGDGRRACASCHVPERAFTDGRARARPFASGGAHGAASLRHTPTLLNAALQPALFADERAATLEDQIGAVLTSPAEMHADVDTVVARLRHSAEYRAHFAAARGVGDADAVTSFAVRAALAAYVRSLASLDSRFDRAVRGGSAPLTAAERRGFNLFMGKARCGTCHFAPLFNGTAPPTFVTSDVEVIGVPRRGARHDAELDPDAGRGAIDGLPAHQHAFKVPSVRNATLTAPYMHNGALRTLPEVLDFYERGGGQGIGAAVASQTLPRRRLHLTPTDRRDIIAFLRTLVDTAGLTGRPQRLPSLGAGTSPSRRVGGEY